MSSRAGASPPLVLRLAEETVGAGTLLLQDARSELARGELARVAELLARLRRNVGREGRNGSSIAVPEVSLGAVLEHDDDGGDRPHDADAEDDDEGPARARDVATHPCSFDLSGIFGHVPTFSLPPWKRRRIRA